MNYKLDLDLSQFLNVEVRTMEMNDGETKRCAIIPLDENSIKENKRSLKAHMRVFERKEKYWNQTHVCVLEWAKPLAKFNFARGLKPPIVGSLTPYFKVDTQHNGGQSANVGNKSLNLNDLF